MSVNEVIDRHLVELDPKISASSPGKPGENSLRLFYVTHAESPSEIYVRSDKLADNWRKFQHRIEAELSQFPRDVEEDILIGDLVGVVNEIYRYRGKILDVIDSKLCLVQNIDTGTRERVEVKYLCQLPDCLLTVNAFCHRVCLAHIQPTGSSKAGEWSHSARERFREKAINPHGVWLTIEVR